MCNLLSIDHGTKILLEGCALHLGCQYNCHKLIFRTYLRLCWLFSHAKVALLCKFALKICLGNMIRWQIVVFLQSQFKYKFAL